MKKGKRNTANPRPVLQLLVSHIGLHGTIGAVARKRLQHLVANLWILETENAKENVLKVVALYFKRNVKSITKAKRMGKKRLVVHRALHIVSNCFHENI